MRISSYTSLLSSPPKEACGGMGNISFSSPISEASTSASSCRSLTPRKKEEKKGLLPVYVQDAVEYDTKSVDSVSTFLASPTLTYGSDDDEVPDLMDRIPENISDLTLPLYDDFLIKNPKVQRPVYQVFFLVIPMYAGYAALFGLQHQLKHRIGIADDTGVASHFFGFATSTLFIFNLFIRICHWYVFRVSAYHRVIISMVSMIGSMCLITSIFLVPSNFLIYSVDVRVILGYSFGGIGIGTFETNLISAITPLGPLTKRWAIIAIPVGIAVVQIGAFILLNFIPCVCIHIAIAFALTTLSLPLWMGLPLSRENVDNCRSFYRAISEWRRWLTQLWTRPLSFMVDMLVIVALGPGAMLFVYDKSHIELKFGDTGFLVPTIYFFAVFNACGTIGGLGGRWFAYHMKLRHPASFLPLSLFGAALLLMKRPEIAPLGAFLIYWGDGCIYAQMCRYIDTSIHSRYAQVSISFWFLIGDIGSVVGSNLAPFIRDWLE